MAQGLSEMQQGMGQGQNGKSGPSDAELMEQLSGEMEGIMKSLRSGQYLAQEGGSRAASDWGYGTTNTKTDSSPGGSEGNRDARDVEGAGNERTEIDFNALYAPEQIPKDSYNARVHGRLNDDGATLMQEFRSLPTDADGLTDYYNIVKAYTGAQEDAVDNEEIPWEYRELVKSYFNGLNTPKDGILPTVESEGGADGVDGNGADGESAEGEKVPATDDGIKLDVLTEEEVDET